MIHTDFAIARIRAYLRDRNIPKSRLASDAGVPESSIRDLHADNWNPTFETLRKLENAVPADFMPIPPPGNTATTNTS